MVVYDSNWYLLAYVLQDVQKDYKRRQWNLHHEQRLQFQEASDDTSAITLNVAEPSSEQDKWTIRPVNAPKV